MNGKNGMATESYLRMRFKEAGVNPSDIERLVQQLCGEKAPPNLHLLHNRLPKTLQRSSFNPDAALSSCTQC
ncbi:hypothetical protein AN477_10375 [Alicyclobacillus ferrooxydans]|uniref:Uncharacterized protein n=1 Tax=Alicyclobacillus ferrooxydans TaxID=471514 RepID=A0A0P9EXB8_9BACL|nr:hypothetical protein AN477_10375 [Alicyclobacillus ferrooxydans]